jgi:Na+-driven multidrug efflux pump
MLIGVLDAHLRSQVNKRLLSVCSCVPAAGDALNCVAQGILRGAGRPGIGAVLNSAGYW